MDPNNPHHHGQYYYQHPHHPSHHPQDGSQIGYATSNSSNPTSPPNGFVPIYTTHQDPTYAQSGGYSATSPTSPTYYTTSSSANNNSGGGPASASSPQTLEEHELKRLRNTAASARFRAKKKQREAQLENSAREKKEKLEALEKRIQDLEDENKWLKALIMEKKDVQGEVARLRERFGAITEEMREFEPAKKDGVGTSKK